jgi:hypothetical protein
MFISSIIRAMSEMTDTWETWTDFHQTELSNVPEDIHLHLAVVRF